VRRIFLLISIVTIIFFSVNALVVNSYAAAQFPSADGHLYHYLALVCYYDNSPCDVFSEERKIENGIRVSKGGEGHVGHPGGDAFYEFSDVGIIEFNILRLKELYTGGQIRATLYLTVLSLGDTFNGCLALYSMEDESENGVIEVADTDTTDYIGEVCGPFKKGETIIFDVTSALDHDLCNLSQTDFSGFVLKPEKYYYSSYIEFYDHSNLLYAPQLRLNSNCVIDTIYGEHSAQTQFLRDFRDNLLNKTPAGQELINLYYQWSPVIVKAMEEDEEYKEDVKQMVDAALPILKAIK